MGCKFWFADYSIFKIPEILTKEYRIYDPSKVSNEAGKDNLYTIENKTQKKYSIWWVEYLEALPWHNHKQSKWF
jgi:hypothetical protein